MKELTFFATCPKGLELLLENELQSLDASQTTQTVAGVKFKGTDEVAYRACLWSRLANRILLPVAHFPVSDANSLYAGISKISWWQHLDVDSTFRIDFTGTSDEISNSQFAAQKVKDAIVDQFRKKMGRRPSVAKVDPMVRINVVLRKGYANVSIDLSGESLHKRGYRLEGAAAPLKENLAAAILIRANWPQIAKNGGSLVDPMCGTGTLLIEGLLIAADIAPALTRKRFGFQGWKKYDSKLWEKIFQEAEARSKKGKQLLLSTFHGFDIDPQSISQAKNSIYRAGFANFIKFQELDIKQLYAKNVQKTNGLCVVNPPYGERLHEQEDLLPLYRLMAYKLKENFLNWEAAVFTGNVEIAKNMGLRAYKKYAFYNGTIPCQLLLFHIKPEWFIDKERK